MYFPYLRCKQFELLALRELAPQLGLSRISPVLEPVKESTSALEKALDALIAHQVNFSIILNPVHGFFTDNPSGLYTFINNRLGGYNNFQFAIIVNQFTNVEALDYLLTKIDFERPFSFVHLQRPTDLDALADWVAHYTLKYNLYNENIQTRRYRGIITGESRVILEDKFISQTKNADYTDRPELFSDEHLYYLDDGFIGFGDYLTVGNDYSETGFLPFAVAIHLTYIRADRSNEIWIRHFVSNSNSDNTDVAGKFAEALEKLIQFLDEENIHTAAAEEFREYYRNGHYPGLGSLKKLSIKHHLELLVQLLA